MISYNYILSEKDINGKDTTTIEYLLGFLEKMLNMFVWQNLPDSLPDWAIEKALVLSGKVGITNDPNHGLTAFVGEYGGNLNPYGIGDTFVGTYIGDKNSHNRIVGTDCVVGWNNKLGISDIHMMQRYSNILSETDTSIIIQLVNSRLTKLPIAGNESEKRQIEECFNAIKKGELKAITKLYQNMDGSTNINASQITDPHDIEYMQDLSRFYDEIRKRSSIELLGIDITSKDKKAQTNSDEVNAYETYSKVTLNDKLNARKKLAEDINKLYGTNIEVDLNEFYKEEVKNSDSSGDYAGENRETPIPDEL